MQNFYLILVLAIIIFISSDISASVQEIECRGEISTGNFTWNAQNFAGFFYDIDNDIGTEEIVAIVNETDVLIGQSPFGLIYKTCVQNEDFKFNGWGNYKVIGFLGNKYFAGYNQNIDPNKNYFYQKSDFDTILSEEILHKILINDNTEIILKVGDPLRLFEGYSLIIESINDDMIVVKLVDKYNNELNPQKLYTPSSNISESTVYYWKNLLDERGLIIIAVHFKDIYYGIDKYGNLIRGGIIDGVWQLSEDSTRIESAKKDKLTMRTKVTESASITANNLGNPIGLIRKKDIDLIDNFKIKVAEDASLKYYIYRLYSNPGTHEIRSAVASGDINWTPQNFAGFYYDLDNDLNTERISTFVTSHESGGEKNYELSGEEPYGLIYNTYAQRKDFDVYGWGSYDSIGFLGKEYFAGYNIEQDNDLLYRNSRIPDIFADDDQLRAVLINNNERNEYKPGECIPLDESQGYTLHIQEIDLDGNTVSLELHDKNGAIVDSKRITPLNYIDSETYVYSPEDGLPVIAAHIANVFRGPDNEAAITVEGIWQISDKPTTISEGSQFDKMTVTDVDDDRRSITMCNIDKTIKLRKDKAERIIYDPNEEWPPRDDISIMGNIWLRTADNKTLRYYLFHLESLNSTLDISSNPENASIYIDGVHVGVSPRSVDISSGNHSIEVSMQGYMGKSLFKTISNIHEHIHVDLAQLPCNISLIIYPPDADVYIDNEPYYKNYINIEHGVTRNIYVSKENYLPTKSILNCTSAINDKLEISLKPFVVASGPSENPEDSASIVDLLPIPGAILAILLLRDYYLNRKNNIKDDNGTKPAKDKKSR